MKRLKYLALATLVAFAACDEGDGVTPVDPVIGTVTVNVTAEGEGVEGVTVSLAGPSSQSATTPASGTVTFQNVEEGSYAVTLSNIPGDVAFGTTAQTVTISETNQNPSLDFGGQFVRTASITVNVSASGEPVPGVPVTIDGPEGTETQTTGAAGNQQFTGLLAGEYTVSIENPDEEQYDFPVTEQTFQLAAGGQRQVNFAGTSEGEDVEADISIQSITAGGAPINLNNVMGQIEVALNVDRGTQLLDRVEVLIDGEVVASQEFNAAAAFGDGPLQQIETIVLNVPTTQVQDADGDGIWAPVIFNGGATVSANLFVIGEPAPIPSNEVPVVMNNPDLVLAGDATLDPADPENTAQDINGDDWFAGSAVFEGPQYLAYSGIEPTSVTWATTTCGTADDADIEGDVETGLVITNVYDCVDVEGAVAVDETSVSVSPTPAPDGPDGSDVTYPTEFSRLGAEFELDGEDRRFIIVSPATPVTVDDVVNMDNLAPAVWVDGEVGQPNETDKVAFHDDFDQWWVNAEYGFDQDSHATDGGVGLDVVTEHLFDDDPGVEACTGEVIETGDDLDETVTSGAPPEDGFVLCAEASDLLGNTGTSGPSNYFGVDKMAPMVRLVGEAGSDNEADFFNPTEAAEFEDFVIYNIDGDREGEEYATSGVVTNAAQWGVEGFDERSGFAQNDAVVGMPAIQSLQQYTADLTSPAACSESVLDDDLPTELSDNWVRVGTTAGFTCPTDLSEPGYYTYSGNVIDRAGNTAEDGPIEFTWMVDAAAAAMISSVSFGQTFFEPGEDGTFTLFGSDDLEVVEADLSLTYPTAEGDLEVGQGAQPIAGAQRFDGIDPFDPALITDAVTGETATLAGIVGRYDWTCSGAGTPYASCGAVNETLPSGSGDEYNTTVGTTAADLLPTAVTAGLIDAGMNDPANVESEAFLPEQWEGSVAEQWSEADIVTWRVFDDAGVVKAEHRASTSITSPFFGTVLLVHLDGATGTVTVCDSDNAPNFADTGFNRFYTYIFESPSEDAACELDGVDDTWHAIGLPANGAPAGLITQGIATPATL